MDEIIKDFEYLAESLEGDYKERAEKGLRWAKRLKALFDRAEGSYQYADWQAFKKEFAK